MHSSAQTTAPDDINRILHEAMADESLELPPPPQVVSEVMRLTRGEAAGEGNADAGAADLARLIQRDMALAGQVMRVANPPYMRAARWSRCPRPSRGWASAKFATLLRGCAQGPGVFRLLSPRGDRPVARVGDHGAVRARDRAPEAPQPRIGLPSDCCIVWAWP
jgi:hypothetical protein